MAMSVHHITYYVLDVCNWFGILVCDSQSVWLWFCNIKTFSFLSLATREKLCLWGVFFSAIETCKSASSVGEFWSLFFPCSLAKLLAHFKFQVFIPYLNMGDQLQNKLKKRLEALLKLPDNQVCCDCKRRGGIFLSYCSPFLVCNTSFLSSYI